MALTLSHPNHKHTPAACCLLATTVMHKHKGVLMRVVHSLKGGAH